MIAKLLRAEGARAEPHILENLVTHRFQKFWVQSWVKKIVKPHAKQSHAHN